MKNYHLRFLGTIEVSSPVNAGPLPERPFGAVMITLAVRAWETGEGR